MDTVPERVRRALDLIFRVEGVIHATIWPRPNGFLVAVRPRFGASHGDVLRRVTMITAAVREGHETWEVILRDGEA